MKDYGPETFGELNAEDYDRLHDPGTTDLCVELIAELAPAGGSILEFAIGTGRVALPLAARGFALHGVEASPLMVEKLRDKPGGADVPVEIADMSDFAIDRRFDFAFLVFNTLYNLTSQDAQVRCFERAAAHLKPGGGFLVETYMPSAAKTPAEGAVTPRRVGYGEAVIDIAKHDPISQRSDYQFVRFTPGGATMTPLPVRYVWPSEMDLMARLAGLSLKARWGGWRRAPIAADSPMQIALYRKPAG